MGFPTHEHVGQATLQGVFSPVGIRILQKDRPAANSIRALHRTITQRTDGGDTVAIYPHSGVTAALAEKIWGGRIAA